MGAALRQTGLPMSIFFMSTFFGVQSMGLPSSKIPWKSWKWIDLGVPPWLSGWWFGTWLLYAFIFFYILGMSIIPTVTHSIIFQRGRAGSTTDQLWKPPSCFDWTSRRARHRFMVQMVQAMTAVPINQLARNKAWPSETILGHHRLCKSHSASRLCKSPAVFLGSW